MTRRKLDTAFDLVTIIRLGAVLGIVAVRYTGTRTDPDGEMPGTTHMPVFGVGSTVNVDLLGGDTPDVRWSARPALLCVNAG